MSPLQAVIRLCVTSLVFADFKHVSCQPVDIQSNLHISSPQGQTSTIMAGPLQPSEAKHECIELAKFLNYTYVGVMGEYCISVNNLRGDVNSAPVYDQCKDGNGNYNHSSATQYMDVYRIIGSESTTMDIKLVVPHSTSHANPKTTGSALSFHVISLFVIFNSLDAIIHCGCF